MTNIKSVGCISYDLLTQGEWYLTNRLTSRQLIANIHWSFYWTDHVYVVIRFGDSVWFSQVEESLCKLFYCLFIQCIFISLGDPVTKIG